MSQFSRPTRRRRSQGYPAATAIQWGKKPFNRGSRWVIMRLSLQLLKYCNILLFCCSSQTLTATGISESSAWLLTVTVDSDVTMYDILKLGTAHFCPMQVDTSWLCHGRLQYSSDWTSIPVSLREPTGGNRRGKLSSWSESVRWLSDNK